MISKKDVHYIAGLSRIHLPDAEAEGLTSDLEAILGYINKLDNLDVSDVEPTTHVLSLKNVYREDEVKPSIGQDKALSITEHKLDGSFKVPKVIE